MTYAEKANRVATESSIALLVMMGNPEDVEFLPLKPEADERAITELRMRWAGRGLRPIGVVGITGATTQCALKIALSPEQSDGLSNAFLAWLHTTFCDGLMAAEVTELERLYHLN
jgi:hypothetical protein